jgi:hypothetical protein
LWSHLAEDERFSIEVSQHIDVAQSRSGKVQYASKHRRASRFASDDVIAYFEQAE